MTPVATAGDPRFFFRTGPHSLTEVAAAMGAEPTAGVAQPGPVRLGLPQAEQAVLMLHGVAPLQLAGPDQVSYADHRRHQAALSETRAGAVILPSELAAFLPSGCVPLVTAAPRIGWARVAALFHPLPPLSPGMHPSAAVDAAATIDPSAEIGPLAVIGAGASIGPRCRIGALAVIGPGVILGADCRVGSHASISHTLAGARVYVYPGARIGQDGFGFEPGPEGFISVPQLGRVILEDDVEIGANSTVDRGAVGDTVIGAGSRLDNLVQIGHNARLGRCCVIVSQAGISGSAVLGDFVMVGGQGGVTGHLNIGKGAKIGAQAGVMGDVAAGVDVVGSPAMPVREFFRQVVTLRRLSSPRRTETKPAGPEKAGTGAD